MNTKEQITRRIASDYPGQYVPTKISIYDQIGLLIEIINGKIAIDNMRPANHVPTLITYYFDRDGDEDVAYMHTLNSVLVNRISQLNGLQNMIKNAADEIVR